METVAVSPLPTSLPGLVSVAAMAATPSTAEAILDASLVNVDMAAVPPLPSSLPGPVSIAAMAATPSVAGTLPDNKDVGVEMVAVHPLLTCPPGLVSLGYGSSSACIRSRSQRGAFKY